jgi:hypothetical protein
LPIVTGQAAVADGRATAVDDGTGEDATDGGGVDGGAFVVAGRGKTGSGEQPMTIRARTAIPRRMRPDYTLRR